MLTLQEFLKSKNIKYLFYDPYVNILIKDDWYYENVADMKNVVDNIEDFMLVLRLMVDVSLKVRQKKIMLLVDIQMWMNTNGYQKNYMKLYHE